MCFALSVMCLAAPAVSAPATSAPATSAPATSAAATSAPATSAPATSAPATTVPTTTAVSDSVISEVYKNFETMIVEESEARYTFAADAMFALYSVMKENNLKDSAALSNQLKKYAEDNNRDLSSIFTNTGLHYVQVILNIFMADGNLDLNNAQKIIENGTALATLLKLFTGAEIVKATQAPSTQAGQTTMVENPKTGDSGVNTAVAFAVLGLGIGTIAVCAKKKES